MSHATYSVGKIIRIRSRFKGSSHLWLNTIGEALRRHIHLCFSCDLHRVNGPDNCPVAAEYEKLSHENTMGHCVTRCPNFVPVPKDRGSEDQT